MLLLILGAVAAIALLNACSNAAMADTAIPDVISYNYDVRPILSDKCFNCHGPDAQKREAGLRLDIASEAYKALQEHPQKHALVPGKPEASELFARITTSDTSLLMPKVSSKLPRLSEHEVAILKKWIEQGAKYEPHWAFVVPQKAPIPLVNEKSWPVN